MKIRLLLVVILLGVFLFYYFEVFTTLSLSSIDNYPLSEPVREYVQYWMDSGSPMRDPINRYPYRFVHSPSDKCTVDADLTLGLVYLVKSAVLHFERREAIRKTWGFEKRFLNIEIRTVFVLGVTDDQALQRRVKSESQKYGDIVQADFTDSYYNLTIKTMMSITWAMEFCSTSKSYFFVDDDEYVSTKNLLQFVRNPLNYPQYLEEQFQAAGKNMRKHNNENTKTGVEQIVDIDLPEDAELYSGHVFRGWKLRPNRFKWSKWHIPVSDYPYNSYPPYVTAGSFVLGNKALKKFYYASHYTKHFPFEDIYVGILAQKLEIAPLHNDHFRIIREPYSEHGYRFVVASHGFSDPDELQRVWEQQKGAGYA